MKSNSVERRELHQYGWRTGPVECRCSVCDWSAAFIAIDASTPAGIVDEFEAHECIDLRTGPVPCSDTPVKTKNQ